jgi:hypothetical protein
MYAPATPVSRTTTAARPFVAFALLALALYSLLAHWEQRFSSVPMFSDPEHPSAQHIFEIDVAVAGSGGTASHDDLSAIDESKPYNPADYPRKVVAHFMVSRADRRAGQLS